MTQARYSLGLLALLSLNACQQPAAKEASAAAAVSAAPVPAKVEAAVAAPVPPAPEMQEFLKNYDVGKLLLRDDGPLNGFMGADHYRVELFFSEVSRDTSTTNRYWVRGKSRYKKTVTPLTGYITLDQVQDQPTPPKSKASRSAAREQNPSAYSALGEFQLREDSVQRGAGLFAGQVVIDFVVAGNGELRIESLTPQTPSRDAGIKLEGTWTSYATARKKPVVLAYYLWNYGDSVLKNFNVGERGPEVNPKYVHLGWDDYWENNEWWVEPGAITARAATDSL
jgi:hypothetical protein